MRTLALGANESALSGSDVMFAASEVLASGDALIAPFAD